MVDRVACAVAGLVRLRLALPAERVAAL